MALLIAGGVHDPNLRVLARRAWLAGIPTVTALSEPGHLPQVCADPESGILWLSGIPIRAGRDPSIQQGAAGPADGGRRAREGWTITAAFLRSDVFARMAAFPGSTTPTHDRRQAAEAGPALRTAPAAPAAANYSALQAGFIGILRGWLAGEPAIRQFNRDRFGRTRSVNKFAALRAAAGCGLAIPKTLSGNDPGAFLNILEAGPMVQKPFRGGNYCRPLVKEQICARLAEGPNLPMITAQTRLAPPELRIFRAGQALLAFNVVSDALDYRTDKTARIVPCDVPPGLAAPLMALTDEMGLDWSASDFKSCPETGRLLYLETNANPMFAAFDRAANGALCDAMMAALGLPARAGAGRAEAMVSWRQQSRWPRRSHPHPDPDGDGCHPEAGPERQPHRAVQ